MRPIRRLLVLRATLISFLMSFSIPLLAQHAEMAHVGKRGQVWFASEVRIGDALLKRGEYQFQHVVTGEDHAMVFRKMVTPGGSGAAFPGKEVARVKCKLEPFGEAVKNQELHFGVNADGATTVNKIYIKGEQAAHVF